MSPRITLDNLTLGYDGHPAVHHLSLVIEPGALVAVVGPNGAGKSTLIKALAGLVRPLQGRIDGLGGVRVAYMPQHSALEPGFPVTVFELVAMGLWHEVGALGRFSRAQRQRCHAALAQVGLAGFAARGIDTLSGGQLQRALFARLMLQDAPVLLLDEPFAAMDARSCEDLLALLPGWQRQGKTVLAVLHDMAQVRAAFPHTLMLARERVAYGPTPEVLTPAHLARMRAMHEAFDDDAPVCAQAPGLAPDAAGTPAAAARPASLSTP